MRRAASTAPRSRSSAGTAAPPATASAEAAFADLVARGVDAIIGPSSCGARRRSSHPLAADCRASRSISASAAGPPGRHRGLRCFRSIPSLDAQGAAPGHAMIGDDRDHRRAAHRRPGRDRGPRALGRRGRRRRDDQRRSAADAAQLVERDPDAVVIVDRRRRSEQTRRPDRRARRVRARGRRTSGSRAAASAATRPPVRLSTARTGSRRASAPTRRSSPACARRTPAPAACASRRRRTTRRCSSRSGRRAGRRRRRPVDRRDPAHGGRRRHPVHQLRRLSRHADDRRPTSPTTAPSGAFGFDDAGDRVRASYLRYAYDGTGTPIVADTVSG